MQDRPTCGYLVMSGKNIGTASPMWTWEGIIHTFGCPCPSQVVSAGRIQPFLLPRHSCIGFSKSTELGFFSPDSFLVNSGLGNRTREQCKNGKKGGTLPGLHVLLMLLLYCIYSWDSWFEKLLLNTCMCLKEGSSQGCQWLNETVVSGKKGVVVKKCFSIEAKILLANLCWTSTCALVCSGCDSKGVEEWKWLRDSGVDSAE